MLKTMPYDITIIEAVIPSFNGEAITIFDSYRQMLQSMSEKDIPLKDVTFIMPHEEYATYVKWILQHMTRDTEKTLPAIKNRIRQIVEDPNEDIGDYIGALYNNFAHNIGDRCQHCFLEWITEITVMSIQELGVAISDCLGEE